MRASEFTLRWAARIETLGGLKAPCDGCPVWYDGTPQGVGRRGRLKGSQPLSVVCLPARHRKPAASDGRFGQAGRRSQRGRGREGGRKEALRRGSEGSHLEADFPVATRVQAGHYLAAQRADEGVR